jgi:hypothetical protein
MVKQQKMKITLFAACSPSATARAEAAEDFGAALSISDIFNGNLLA